MATEIDEADNCALLKSMCLACADDLARWARAFDDQDEPLLVTLLEGLQQHLMARSANGT